MICQNHIGFSDINQLAALQKAFFDCIAKVSAMKALIHDNGLQFSPQWPKPKPGPGEALVRVRMAGICKTDHEIERGYMNFTGVLGHEFVGEVEWVNHDAYQHLPGKRVVGEINCGCNICSWCMQGLAAHCMARTVIGIAGRDGSLAEYLAIPTASLHIVPDAVSDRSAVFVEPLAAAFQIMAQVHIRPTDRVCVLGDGRLGLLAALALKLGPSAPDLVGKHPEKLAVASDQKINTILLEEMPPEQTYDLVIEATGRPEGFETARRIFRPRGRVVLKSTFAESGACSLTPLVQNEITLVGSRCGPFAPALRALTENRLDVTPLITAVYPLDAALDAFEASRAPHALKVLVAPSG